MPRKGHIAKRDVLADPIYNSKVVTRLIGIEKKLNELGYEGWELVAVECGTYYFKREYKG